ncbi:MAG: NAD-dependent epimerase/dehydratase family protein [Nocardioides sp.]
MHVVVGSGPLGTAVARSLLERGEQVRQVSRTGRTVVAGAEARAADIRDTAAFRSALLGAAVVYQCAAPAYTAWTREFPDLQTSVVDAAAAAGADLVIGDNLYMYGPPGDAPISEGRAEHPTTRKGRLRREMAAAALAAHHEGRLRVALSRPSDYLGPGYDQSGLAVFRAALEGRTMGFYGRADMPHSFSYVPDAGAAMAALGTTGDGWGRIWIPPVLPAMTQAELAERVWRAAGGVGRPRARYTGRGAVRLAGLVSPLAREFAEMMYGVEAPYIVDSSRFEREFGFVATPVDEVVRETLEWYRER